MRTELKIGIFVGLLVIAGAIIFFVNQGQKTGGNVTDVLPMTAPAGKVKPPAAKPGGDKPVVDRPATPTPRPIITPPPRPVAEPSTTPPGGAATGPIAPPPGPAVTPEPASRPRITPELPPLVAPPVTAEPTTRPGAGPAASESPTRTPGVSVPPRTPAEPPAAAPLPAPPRTPSAAAKKYTVVEGDSLWSIAQEQYGDGHLWTKLKAANPGIDDFVKVGQVLVVPPKEEILGTTEPTQPAARPGTTPTEPKTTPRPEPGATPATTYVVEQGDTLYGIAQKLLGNGLRWRELYEANKDKLERPEDLRVGMQLRVPAKDATTRPAEPARPARGNAGNSGARSRP